VSGMVAGGAAAAGKAPLSSVTAVALSKWLVAGVVGGVVASTATYVVHEAATRDREPRAARSAAPRVAERPPTAAPHVALNPLPEPPVPSGAPPGPSAAFGAIDSPSTSPHGHAGGASETEPEPGPGAPKANLQDALGVEAARVDAARRALATGDLDGALTQLDAYERLRSLGVLEREALLLRIQVLVRRGEHVSAVALARRYLTTHPNDAHAARLQALIQNGGTAWPNLEGIDR
jgi:hypothetical protein